MTTQRPSSRAGGLLRHFLVVVVLIGLAGLIVWGFVSGRGEAVNEAQRERPVKAPPRIGEANGQPVVKLDAQTLKANGIEVAALLSAPYQAQLRGYATVLDLTQINDMSNSFASAKALLQTAQARLAASKTAYDRARTLYRGQQNVSLAQFQAADATLQTDQAALAAADWQLRTLSATAVQAFGPVVGKAIATASPLASELIEGQVLLLQVTLPPGAALSAPPQTATIQLAGGPPDDIRFVSPATRTDPRIQGRSFFYLARASSGVLAGMNVLVSLPSGTSGTGLIIPPSAIVWWQDRAWIYREADAGTFVRTQVSTGLASGDGGYVVNDQPADARIVTQGAQLLLSEEFRTQIKVGAD